MQTCAITRPPVLREGPAINEHERILATAGRKSDLWREDLLVQMLTRHAGRRVLIVDNNPADRVRMGELLAAARLVLDFAADGAEAITRASDRPADLVLMNVRLPVMDGLTAARVLRRLPFARAVPIVAMSEGCIDDEYASYFVAGMDDVVAKPFVADAVHRRLLRWLDRRAAAANAAWRLPAPSAVVARIND